MPFKSLRNRRLELEPLPRATRRGFTLVELLVVIAIVGILISIILPAINSVRMTTRATVCKNNLRQLAFGIEAYTEHRNGRLPAQWRTASPTRWENFAWTVDILPMIDQQNIRDKLNLKESPFSTENRTYTSISISVFECPASPNEPRKIEALGDGQYQLTGLAAGAKDYVAIHSVRSVDGNHVDPGAWNGQGRTVDTNRSSDSFVADTESPPPDENVVPVDDSFSTQVRTIQANLAGVRDGLTNTALLIEQAGKPGVQGDSSLLGPPIFEGPWATAELNSFSGDGVNVDNRTNPFGFHGNVNVAMCDASVHTWSPAIDAVVMRSLLTRASGEIVDLTDVE